MIDCNTNYGDIFPFSLIDDNGIINLSFNSNSNCFCSKQLLHDCCLKSLPRFELISNISNIPHLIGTDVENNLVHQVDFNYYSIHDFHSSPEIDQAISHHNSFSVFHSNVSETKIMSNKDPIGNTNITGYLFASQPSLHNAGFYILYDCDFHFRDDLSCTTDDFECLWIEVHSKSHSNVVCSVTYRPPNSNLENFSIYLTAVMEKISREKKYCILMGDLNINLVNFESHTHTDEFINNMGVYCFQPHITQPIRITDHTATLIDNIYFNSIDHYTIRGNMT